MKRLFSVVIIAACLFMSAQKAEAQSSTTVKAWAAFVTIPGIGPVAAVTYGWFYGHYRAYFGGNLVQVAPVVESVPPGSKFPKGTTFQNLTIEGRIPTTVERFMFMQNCVEQDEMVPE